MTTCPAATPTPSTNNDACESGGANNGCFISAASNLARVARGRNDDDRIAHSSIAHGNRSRGVYVRPAHTRTAPVDTHKEGSLELRGQPREGMSHARAVE